MPKRLIFPSDLSATPQTPCLSAFRLKDWTHENFKPDKKHKKKPNTQKLLVDDIKNTPNLNSSDVVRFVTEQNDFFEDAAYMEVE